ncbi:Asparagine synthetase [glutamine-hydrolyzing] [hydrothermal vent metagenome]|uniref:Asparagine synthetase [glutamine-hydrolyzing] n=1 Tax=hydrothermal vent metagenome TaxID=652676 RepID=A0A3B0WID0_9ZZZZ
MCGLCGELRFDASTPDAGVIERMKEKLQKRGPDSEGRYIKSPIAFGHQRLAIIDLSDKAAQPMLDETAGIALVFNGTIYNYPDLRKQLQALGHQFKSSGDTEVILRAYIEWGEKCVARLQGMFAFAVWDNKKQTLLLARDRTGIKPLYFSQTSQRLLFASNTQALIHADNKIDTAIDSTALHNLFSLHAVVPAPRTVLKGIRKVKPAHYMLIDAKGAVTEKRYWSLTAKRPDTKMTEQDWVQAIHDELRRAVEKRVKIADVPVGVLLSGGIDSSLLVGLLAEAGQKNLKTFSVGFEDAPEEKGNEFEYSDAVAQMFETEHHQLMVPNNQVLPRLPEAFANMAEPMFGQDAVAFYLLSEVVSKEVKVVQSGQGADEVFGGYFWYPRMHHSLKKGINRFSDEYFDRDHAEYLETVNARFHTDDVTSQIMQDLLDEVEADEYLDRVLATDVTTLIVDDPVKRVDNMTMAWGLEARVPFLDTQLIELAAAMPPEMKLPNGGKHVLKELSRGFLPDSVVNRSKAYFPMPALKYVRGEFLEFMKEILLSDGAKQRGLYNGAYVEKLLSKPEDYLTRLQGSKLWHLAALELWWQQNISH